MTEKQTKENYLDNIPVRNIDWEKDEQGKVYLVKEKTRNKLLKKIIELVDRRQFFYIHLDELGTASWLLCDGRRSIIEISRQMQAEKGGTFIQSETRVAQFFAMLKKNKFITFA